MPFLRETGCAALQQVSVLFDLLRRALPAKAMSDMRQEDAYTVQALRRM